MGAASSGLARAYAVGLTGIAGQVVEVEAHLAAGTPAFAVTGLPDAAVREARDRIKAAIVNSRVEWPNRRITVGLSPASLPKHGTGYDLAMAASLLAAAGQVPTGPLGGYLLVGELVSPKYKPDVVAMGTNTDPYQPVERELKITRQILRVLSDFTNPVGIVTKNQLVARDIDIS